MSRAHPHSSTELIVEETEHLRVSMSGNIVIVEPVGGLDTATVEALDRLLSEVTTPTVIDLRRCAPTDTAAPDWLDLQRWHRAPDSVCIVTGRSDGGGHAIADEHHLAVFVQPADAIWALLLAETGYGAGWG
jgi:hypothetical protein